MVAGATLIALSLAAGPLGAAAGLAAAGSSPAITAAVATAMVAGPAGWAVLGADERSWDCWKAVVHDESVEPSGGRPLREVMLDKRIKKVEMVEKGGCQQILLQNQWNENFQVDFVLVDGQLAAHATRC